MAVHVPFIKDHGTCTTRVCLNEDKRVKIVCINYASGHVVMNLTFVCVRWISGVVQVRYLNTS